MVINRPMAIVAATALGAMFVVGVGLTLWLAHRSEPTHTAAVRINEYHPAPVSQQPAPTLSMVQVAPKLEPEQPTPPPDQPPSPKPPEGKVYLVPSAAAEQPKRAAPKERVPIKWVRIEALDVYDKPTKIPSDMIEYMNTRPFNLLPVLEDGVCVEYHGPDAWTGKEKKLGEYCAGDDPSNSLQWIQRATTLRALYQEKVQVLFYRCPVVPELVSSPNNFVGDLTFGRVGVSRDAPCGYYRN